MPNSRTICNESEIISIYLGNMKSFELTHTRMLELQSQENPDEEELYKVIKKMWKLSNEIRKNSITFRKMFTGVMAAFECNLQSLIHGDRDEC